GSQFPREIHGVADPRIHALPADGTVDVRGVADEKRPTGTETVGDAMMHAIRREPVHPRDVNPHPVDDTLADVVPRQLIVLMLALVANGADEPRAPIAVQREHAEKIGPVESDVHLSVHARSAAADVGDAERLL